MREDIKQLLVVQELDVKIRELVECKKTAVRKLESLRNEVDDDEKAIEDERNRLMGSRVHIKELDLEIADKKNHIIKYQEQQFKVKNNKEYTALLHEISKQESDIRILEDRMLEFMEEAEVEDRTLDGVRADLVVAQRKFRETEVESRTLMDQLRNETEAKEKERDEEISRLDPDIYEIYEMVFSRKSDLAVVKVINDTCGGCNVELRAQVLNDLYRGDITSQCETCGRFIYI